MEENYTPQTEQRNQGTQITLTPQKIYYILGGIFIAVAFIFIFGIGDLDVESISKTAERSRNVSEVSNIVKSVLRNLFRNGSFGIFWALLGCTSLIMGKLTEMKNDKK